MILSSKVVWAGIVFLSLTAGISGPRPDGARFGRQSQQRRAQRSGTSPTTTSSRCSEVCGTKRHYSGQVDGVVGLRTRASIRGFQKTENLPVTGQLDAQTAGRLGVEPERRELTGFDLRSLNLRLA